MSKINESSRTVNVLRNSVVTIICQCIYFIMGFVCRTVFTKTLGAEYLGISGLFTNILTILSFAELGIGSALVYRLYAPLAEKDYEKVNALLALYKKAYNFIIVIVLVIGVGLIPIIPYVVEAPNVKENIIGLYMVYLIQTITSYVLVYKKSLFIADQKNYVVDVCTQIFNILMNIFQCIFLVLTHDFILYCVLNIIFNLLNNIVCGCLTKKRYLFLSNKVDKSLYKNDLKGIIRDVKGLLLTKIASTAFSGTDNIFISAFVGIKYVGILSNYTLLINIINSFMNKVFDAVTASLGNLAITGDNKKTEKVLKKMFFLNVTLYGIVFIEMSVVLPQFVTKIWLSEEYYLPYSIIIVVLIEMILRSIHYPIYITRNAFGSFSEHKIYFVIAAILNIVLDFILVKPLGILGLYISTIICRGITYMVDIFVVYKLYLKSSVFNYLGMLIKWLVFLGIMLVIAKASTSWIAGFGLINLIIKGVLIVIEYMLAFCILFYKSDECLYFRNLLIKMLKKSRK